MYINSKYFGSISYEPKDIIHFRPGLFGFEDYTEYLLIYFLPDSKALLCLQSLEDEQLAFVMMDPYSLLPAYSPMLTEEDQNALSLSEDTPAACFVLCTPREPVCSSTVNLCSPVIINTEAGIAGQVILDNHQAYSFRYPLSCLSNQRKEA